MRYDESRDACNSLTRCLRDLRRRKFWLDISSISRHSAITDKTRINQGYSTADYDDQ